MVAVGNSPITLPCYWRCCSTVMRPGYFPVASWSKRPTILLPSVLSPADAHPDHDTIATFRKRFLPELEGLFVQMLVVARVMGVFKLGKVSLDGTKIKANASKHKAMSWGYANKLEEQLRREVQELLRRAEHADAEDEPEIDIPDELARREDRLAAIKKAKEEIERRAQERFEAEQAEHEAKLKQRKDKEAKTGKKAGGRRAEAT